MPCAVHTERSARSPGARGSSSICGGLSPSRAVTRARVAWPAPEHRTLRPRSLAPGPIDSGGSPGASCSRRRRDALPRHPALRWRPGRGCRTAARGKARWHGLHKAGPAAGWRGRAGAMLGQGVRHPPPRCPNRVRQGPGAAVPPANLPHPARQAKTPERHHPRPRSPPRQRCRGGIVAAARAGWRRGKSVGLGVTRRWLRSLPGSADASGWT